MHCLAYKRQHHLGRPPPHEARRFKVPTLSKTVRLRWTNHLFASYRLSQMLQESASIPLALAREVCGWQRFSRASAACHKEACRLRRASFSPLRLCGGAAGASAQHNACHEPFKSSFRKSLDFRNLARRSSSRNFISHYGKIGAFDCNREAPRCKSPL